MLNGLLSKVKKRYGAKTMKKIKIIAIAKDEAPYLAEWIYHHLYFGFDSITVYVNRSSDLSADILEAISLKEPRVDWKSGDWVDYLGDGIRTHLQQILYAKAYNEAIEQGFTHVLFIDIDEFWLPLDFSLSIKSFLESFEEKASISFQWFCELGSGENIFQPLSKNIRGVNNLNVKTLINLAGGIRRIGIHIPILDKGAAHHYFADGRRFVRDKNKTQLSSKDFLGTKNAVIVHRIYRSRLEFLATLMRGRPSKPDQWKGNRGRYFTNSKLQHEIKISDGLWDAYSSGYSSFISAFSLDDMIVKARESVLLRAKNATSELMQLDPGNELLKISK